MGSLPADLAGPVPVALAQAENTIPGPARMPGGSVYRPKWDGYRLDFDLLQQRLVAPPTKAAALRRAQPASYLAFDLLAQSRKGGRADS